MIALCNPGVRFDGARDSLWTSASEVSEPKWCFVTGKKVDQSASRFFQASVKYLTLAFDVSSFSAERLSTELISMRKSMD